jgi:hypothetical protein
MKVSLSHEEKKTGMIRKTTHHGVTVHVQFSPAEEAIVRERKLERTVILERDYPSDVDPEKFESKGLARRMATAAVSGMDALHFHLTIGKLLKGPDTYFMATPLQAKEYEARLREQLPMLKEYIVENEGVEQKSDSFEL